MVWNWGKTGEAVKTSEIEGEFLNCGSMQSSIRRNFGLDTDKRRTPTAERGIAEMMVDLYRNFAKPLSHQTLYNEAAPSSRYGLNIGLNLGLHTKHQA